MKTLKQHLQMLNQYRDNNLTELTIAKVKEWLQEHQKEVDSGIAYKLMHLRKAQHYAEAKQILLKQLIEESEQ